MARPLAIVRASTSSGESVTAATDVYALAGASGNVTVTVVNQGDGSMPSSEDEPYVSSDDIINIAVADSLLATFAVPALASGGAADVVVPFTDVGTQVPGRYHLGVWVDVDDIADEYSEANNANPFLVGTRGNVPIIVE